MNIAEQVKAWEAKRQQAEERQLEILAKAAADGERTLDEDEADEHDSLATEIKHIDAHLGRLKAHEDKAAATAEPVRTTSKRGPTVFTRKQDPDDEFPGQSFTRRVIAKTLAHLSGGDLTPAAVAHQRWGKSHPRLVEVIKEGVPGGAAHVADAWAAELAAADARYTGDFVEYLNALTVFNQLPLREIPHNVTVKGQDGQATAFWVGESKAIPVTTLDFSDVTLSRSKVAAIAVISKELIQDSSPSAEMLVRDGLVNASAQRIDATFLGTAPASGATPAGILNGAATVSSAGSDGDSVRSDIAGLVKNFTDNFNATGLQFVMNTNLEVSLSLLRNALGQAEFPEMLQNRLWRYPFVTGDNVGATHLILLKPSDIYKIGDQGIQVSVSDQATIEQDTAPLGDAENPTAASATLSSMFQTENVALKVVRPLNFAKRRASAVAYVTNAVYGETSSS